MVIANAQAQPASRADPAPRAWGKHMLVSLAPVALMLVLHLVHLLAVPLLSGAAQMGMEMEGHAHHDGMHEGAAGGASVGVDWFLAASLLINLFGIGYSLRLLWLTRGSRRRGGYAVFLCRGVAVATLAASTWMLAAAVI